MFYVFEDVITQNPFRMAGGAILVGLGVYLVKPKYPKKQIEDTINNTKLFVKYGEEEYKPKVVKTYKREYDYHVIVSIPKGISDEDFQNKQRYFEIALQAETEIYERDGQIHMIVRPQKLPESVYWEGEDETAYSSRA